MLLLELAKEGPPRRFEGPQAASRYRIDLRRGTRPPRQQPEERNKAISEKETRQIDTCPGFLLSEKSHGIARKTLGDLFLLDDRGKEGPEIVRKEIGYCSPKS
ncbi:hypothetical protein V1477_019791 [Vespula maculifrons]|uniref:Uncharacterized protein n=1 Tax=Vespula maculifrons TaxID=7453 RepID=A0ABD2AU39_VESMC